MPIVVSGNMSSVDESCGCILVVYLQSHSLLSLVSCVDEVLPDEMARSTRNGERTVVESLSTAIEPSRVEYLANGARWRI